MKPSGTGNASALPNENVTTPSAPSLRKDNVVRLNVEPVRPNHNPESGQGDLGFMRPVQDEKSEMMDKLASMEKASNSRFKNWAIKEDKKRNPGPVLAKPASKPKQDKRQETLPFDAQKQNQGAVQAANDIENTPLEVVQRSRLRMKDELLSMELPLFALSKTPDLKPRTFRRRNGCGQVTIIPSGCGPATVFDNDVPIYCTSVIDDLLERKLTPSRTLVIDTADFLRKTKRGDGGKAYESVIDMLRRLRGTSIETDIPTNGIRQIHGFGIIENYEILLKKERVVSRNNTKTGKQETHEVTSVFRFSVTLSEWQYNSIRHEKRHVLPIDDAYFELDSAVERRLCQIARHHCGDQPLWKIDIEHLADKVGTRGELRKFREDIRNAIREDRLPGYHIALDSNAKPNRVVFYRKAEEGLKDDEKAKINRARSDALIGMSKGDFNAFEWFEKLERPGSKEAVFAQPLEKVKLA